MEEKKNENEERKIVKIRLSTAILCFIILALTLGLVFMYLYYNKKDDNKNTVETQNTASTSSNTTTTNTSENTVANTVTNKTQNTAESNNTSSSSVKKETLDVNNELVKKLYKYIIVDNDNSGKLLYKSQKITNKTIDEDVKYLTVFENLDTGLATKNQVSEIEWNYTYTKETFEKKAKEIFGNDVELPNNNFSYELLGRIVSCENGVYKDSRMQGGGDVPWAGIHKIISAEKNNDEITIIDRFAYIYRTYNNLNSPENGIYSSSDRKEQILKGIYDEKIYIGLESIDSIEERNNIIFKNLEKVISADNLKKYKHTFKKNSDGSYYWYSTEPIE